MTERGWKGARGHVRIDSQCVDRGLGLARPLDSASLSALGVRMSRREKQMCAEEGFFFLKSPTI